MITIIGIAGSLRAGSYNMALLRAAAELISPETTLEIASIREIPLYDADVEARGMPQAVTALSAKVKDADALLIATPEYNFSFPGVLKNVIDWLSRPPLDAVFVRKPLAIMGAGGRLGSARAQYHLRQVCGCLSMLPVPRPEIFIASAWEKFDDGRLTDQAAVKQVEELLAALAEWTRLLQRAAHA